MNNLLALVDFDGLLYQASKETIEESIISLKDRVNNIIEKTNCDFWTGFVGGKDNFRFKIDPQYKANRTQPKPKWYKALKEWSIAEYNLNICNGYEADDICAYMNNQKLYLYSSGQIYTKLEVFEGELIKTIICSPDKDILENIPGKHFNYTYKVLDKNNPESVNKGWFVETNEEDSKRFIWQQMITGDSADGIIGLRGKGLAYFNKMRVNKIDANLPFLVAHEYIAHHGNISQGIYEYQKNYRLLHILENDEDFMRECNKLPDFPKINKVDKVVNDNVIDF